jgi:hypothetical protein
VIGALRAFAFVTEQSNSGFPIPNGRCLGAMLRLAIRLGQQGVTVDETLTHGIPARELAPRILSSFSFTVVPQVLINF